MPVPDAPAGPARAERPGGPDRRAWSRRGTGRRGPPRRNRRDGSAGRRRPPGASGRTGSHGGSRPDRPDRGEPRRCQAQPAQPAQPAPPAPAGANSTVAGPAGASRPRGPRRPDGPDPVRLDGGRPRGRCGSRRPGGPCRPGRPDPAPTRRSPARRAPAALPARRALPARPAQTRRCPVRREPQARQGLWARPAPAGPPERPAQTRPSPARPARGPRAPRALPALPADSPSTPTSTTCPARRWRSRHRHVRLQRRHDAGHHTCQRALPASTSRTPACTRSTFSVSGTEPNQMSLFVNGVRRARNDLRLGRRHPAEHRSGDPRARSRRRPHRRQPFVGGRDRPRHADRRHAGDRERVGHAREARVDRHAAPAHARLPCRRLPLASVGLVGGTRDCRRDSSDHEHRGCATSSPPAHPARPRSPSCTRRAGCSPRRACRSPAAAQFRPSRPITGVQTALPVIGRTATPDGDQLLHVLLPGRPNGSRGWIAAGRHDLVKTSWRIVVRTASRRVLVFHHGRLVAASSRSSASHRHRLRTGSSSWKRACACPRQPRWRPMLSR